VKSGIRSGEMGVCVAHDIALYNCYRAMSSECESGGTAAKLVFNVVCSIFDLKNYYVERKAGVLTGYYAIDSL